MKHVITINKKIKNEALRKYIKEVSLNLLHDTFPDVDLPDIIDKVKIDRTPSDHTLITWEGKVEAKVFGRPDLLSLSLYEDRAVIDSPWGQVRFDLS